jgi:predicted RNA binding protein with dsRBD fold (UPF0201 family)
MLLARALMAASLLAQTTFHLRKQAALAQLVQLVQQDLLVLLVQHPQ